MNSQFRKKINARLNAPPSAPIEASRKFLQSYCSDAESLQEIRNHVARMLAVNPRTVLAGLAGIEGLLVNPPSEDRTLLSLVAYDANWVLNDRSDEGAKVWLQGIAQLLREELQKKNLLPERPKRDQIDENNLG